MKRTFLIFFCLSIVFVGQSQTSGDNNRNVNYYYAGGKAHYWQDDLNYFKESNGIIDLDIVEYCTKGLEQSLTRVNQNEENISSLLEEKQEITQMISDLIDSNKTERSLQNRIKDYLGKHKK